jgi:NDP-hexose-3-ketoreductase
MRFAVVGCGNIARKSVIPAIIKSELTTLAVCIDRRPEKGKELTTAYQCGFATSISEAVEKFEFDAIYISTPIGIHKEAIIEAALAGKHILCEKSIVPTIEDSKEIVELCQKQNVALFEGFMYQFHEQHNKVKELIQNNEIGKPFHLQAWFGFPPIKETDFRYNKSLGGGAVLDAGSYTFHLARHFFNAEPEHVYAVLENESHDVDIRGTVMFDFGQSQTAHVVFGFNNSYQNKYEIWGTTGKLSLNRAFAVPPDFSSTLTIEKQGVINEMRMPTCDHFIEELNYFVQNHTSLQLREDWLAEIIAQSSLISRVLAFV